jgi:hypothetical protein
MQPAQTRRVKPQEIVKLPPQPAREPHIESAPLPEPLDAGW